MNPAVTGSQVRLSELVASLSLATDLGHELPRSPGHARDCCPAAVARRTGWRETAGLVASELERHLPSPSILTAEQRAGDSETFCSHVLHSEPDGSFSIVALVWRPGHMTRIHDHVTWGAFAVIQGDIHRVRNAGNRTAISIHIYGTDVCRLGSSVRHDYDLPALAA